jgi:hypothetical protein
MEQYNLTAVEDPLQQNGEPEKFLEKHRSREESYAIGKSRRKTCPRESHAEWKTFPARPDPIELVMEAEVGRIADLLPLRHGRMSVSPFTFFRGSALNMVADLSLDLRQVSGCNAVAMHTSSTLAVLPHRKEESFYPLTILMKPSLLPGNGI